MRERRLITLLTHALTHESFAHLSKIARLISSLVHYAISVMNTLLFCSSSVAVNKLIGGRRMLGIYVLGAIVSAVILHLTQKDRKGSAVHHHSSGSNGGYAALTGYLSIVAPNMSFEFFGSSIPVWLASLI